MSDELREAEVRLCRVNKIINDLETNEAFNMLCDDFMESVKLSDSNWHMVELNDEKSIRNLISLKYNKLQGLAVVNVIDAYKQEREVLMKTIEELKNPDLYQRSYTE